MASDLVYRFVDPCEDRMLLGNKGANLVKMSKLGLPVPPGFTITISAFHRFMKDGKLPDEEISEAMRWLESAIGRRFGQGLAVSVRSSGPVSMPGMMDTVLNVDDWDTLRRSTREVFESWDSKRAVEYRRLHDIPNDLGTAVVIQAMVMGNRGSDSGTGVLFTRSPNTGENEFFGEYLENAQGEDLVSGARTPQPVTALKEKQPEVFKDLERQARRLEQHFREMQDIEFTVEDGRLFILQTRNGKRTGQAAVRIAVEFAQSGLISREEALARVTPDDLESMLHSRIEHPEQHTALVHGLNAAPGAATGKVVFDPARAAAQADAAPVILVRPETSPDDIQGIAAAVGVLTTRGGLSSHAAIVTRAMGKPAVCGAEDAVVDLENRTLSVGGTTVREGDTLTIDGTTGDVYLGSIPLVAGEPTPELNTLLEWADEAKKIGVWANADTPDMIAAAQRFGAEGIGLLRTERLFNAPEPLKAIRRFILAEDDEERTASLEVLHKLQRDDFVEIFRQLDGLPVIIRLLDLPLHEFLPEGAVTDERVAERRAELAEVNPMMGHRGVRLGITYPDLYRTQVDAIREAKAQVDANVHVMIPQVMSEREPAEIKRHINSAGLPVGVMIETVRACLRAKELAETVDFFSFGTNDLTQAVLSFSREDAEQKFLNPYLEKGVLDANPFETIDPDGVARMVEIGVSAARKVDAGFEIGVCGEHGGDPASIKILSDIGVSYVSCSPYRIPVARLAAAQAALARKG